MHRFTEVTISFKKDWDEEYGIKEKFSGIGIRKCSVKVVDFCKDTWSSDGKNRFRFLKFKAAKNFCLTIR